MRADFELLLSANKDKCFAALDSLVEELNANKKRTVSKFLSHEGSEDFLWALVGMVASSVQR